jgi:hypothetical protein
MNGARTGATVAPVLGSLPSRTLSLGAAALAAGLLATAFALAVGAPQARAASCSGPIQGNGSFSFSCDTQLGTTGSPSTNRFILRGDPDFMTLTSATVSSPAGVVCGSAFGTDQFCTSSATIPAGTTVAGSVVAAEGSFCNVIDAPRLDAFFSGSPYGTSYTSGLRCAPSGSGKKNGDTPKWKKKCKKIKSKEKRKKCFAKHKNGEK